MGKQSKRSQLGYLLLISCAVLVIAGALFASWYFPHPMPAHPGGSAISAESGENASSGALNDPSSSPDASKTPLPEMSFTVAATGDFLSHAPVMQAAWDPATGLYDGAKQLDPIAAFIKNADLALCHQEVPFGSPGSPPHGYPVFSMPYEMAADFSDMGYDGCSTASNHSWDQGLDGLQRTLDNLNKEGLGATGTRASAKETPWQMYELTKDGRTVRIAHLSFVYGLNYGDFPYVDQNPWSIEIANPQDIVNYARDARSTGADIVIVSRHAGTEYQFEPNDQEKEWDQILAESGQVDLVIGTHPHIPQRIEKLPGGVDGQGMWVYRSLGNLLSSQTLAQSIGTQMGEIALATITVPPTGPAHVEAGYVMLALDRTTFKAFPMAGFIQGNPPEESGLSTETVQGYYAKLKEIIGDEATEVTSPNSPSTAEVQALPRQVQVRTF